jgi:hypothetical protein
MIYNQLSHSLTLETKFRTKSTGNEIPESWNRSAWQRIRIEIRVLLIYILHGVSRYHVITADSAVFIQISNNKVFRAYRSSCYTGKLTQPYINKG